MHSEVNACIFYLGKLPDFAWLSLLTLSKQVSEIHLFSDSPKPSWVSIHNLFRHPVDSTTLTNGFSEICKIKIKNNISGYKLCDFKPFWPFYARIHLNRPDAIFLTCDLDCLYGELKHYTDALLDINNPVFIGQCGHLQGANQIFTNLFHEKLNKFFGQAWQKILLSPKNFAFDEYKYLNKMLANWTTASADKLRWNQKITIDSVDIDYWSLIPIDQNKQHINAIFWKDGVNFVSRPFIDNGHSLSCPPYVHFQKRSVMVDEAVMTNELKLPVHLNFIGIDGFHADIQAQPWLDVTKFDSTHWFMHMLRSRLNAKVSREAIFRW